MTRRHKVTGAGDTRPTSIKKGTDMQIDFGQKFVDLGDDPIVDDKGVALTLADAAMNGLVMQFQDEQGLSGEEKLKRWELALRIKRADGPLEVSAEDIALVKKVVAKSYAPLVSGQAWHMLEQRNG